MASQPRFWSRRSEWYVATGEDLSATSASSRANVCRPRASRPSTNARAFASIRFHVLALIAMFRKWTAESRRHQRSLGKVPDCMGT
jgi:hypothetical protein